jgi:putative ABC transport system ATP-binding protein
VPNNVLHADRLSKSFENITAVKNASLHVSNAEIVSVMGRSGSGKTTLLHMLAGLERPSSGHIFFRDQDINGLSEDELALWRRKNIGLVFQAFFLVPTLSALENVCFPLYPERMPSSERGKKAMMRLSQVGLTGRMTHRPSRMSGGEQQRVAIARALVNSPGLILADEPTGNLDSATGKEILDLFRRLRDETSTAFLIITHDEKVAAASDRIIHIIDGESNDE